jgi:hypothetical protein
MCEEDPRLRLKEESPACSVIPALQAVSPTTGRRLLIIFGVFRKNCHFVV